jgi:hypothetical protein
MLRNACRVGYQHCHPIVSAARLGYRVSVQWVPDQPPDALTVWPIFERPLDYPDGYVLRPQFVNRQGMTVSGYMWVAPTLQEIRAALPPGLVLFPRRDGDPPFLVESWV